MGDLLSPVVPLFESALRFRVARAGVLAANVANADTPGFRPADLHFDALLNREQEKLARTHPGHFPVAPTNEEENYRLELAPRGQRPDGNGVQLERQIVLYSRNAGAFTDQAAVLSRLLSLTRTAISGEGG